MKMYDLGVEERKPDITSPATVGMSMNAYKPTMRISTSQCPDLAGLTVGDKIVLNVLCTVTALDMADEFDSRTGIIVELRADKCGKDMESGNAGMLGPADSGVSAAPGAMGGGMGGGM